MGHALYHTESNNIPIAKCMQINLSITNEIIYSIGCYSTVNSGMKIKSSGMCRFVGYLYFQ